MAACKCRRSSHPAAASVPWYYWLTAHALIHGAAVAVVLRWWGGIDPATAVWFGVAEAVVHWLIDLGKCERLYGIHIDQGLHVGCNKLTGGLRYPTCGLNFNEPDSTSLLDLAQIFLSCPACFPRPLRSSSSTKLTLSPSISIRMPAASSAVA